MRDSCGWIEDIRLELNKTEHINDLFHYILDIDPKKASKAFAQHFSCGSSVTGEDEVVIQGDVYDDIVDYVQDKWPQVRSR